MRIDIKGGGSGKGYGNYILRENKKDVDFSKIKVLSGDMKLGDEIVNSSNYKDNAFNIVLEFKGKISDDKAKAVTDEFEKLFMHGFSKSEYHLDAVLHQDTANSHVHIRIPKKNLLTDTTLRLYMDKTDRARVNLIRDYIEEKYDLEKMKDNLKMQPKPKAEIIQEWRKEREQKPFDFSKKRGRDEAQNYIVNYIKELHEAELINSIDDVRKVLKDIELIPSEKQGHDYKTDTYYITVANNTGKLALKGELFNERFYTEFERKDREKQINDNRRPAGTGQSTITSFQKLTSNLEKALNKRYEEVTKRYEPSRRRARERYIRLQRERPKVDSRGAEQGEQAIQHHNSNANNTISSTIIPDSQKIEREASIERMDDTEEEPLSRQSREQIYSYTGNRYKALKRQANILYPDDRKRGIDGTHRNATSRHGKTETRERPERTSSYERFRESRESLYSKARGTMQDRANERGRRRQYSESINRVGETVTDLEGSLSRRYKDINRESANTLESALELTRAIEKEIRQKIQQDNSYCVSM